MSAILLDSDIVHYEVLGRGRPVIFLHGWVGSWRYWIPVMQAASVKYRAYAVDLWGFGDSSKEQARYRLEQQLDLLDSFLDHLGIIKCVLIGHGLGAILAVQYALRRPDSVDRLMAISYPVDGIDQLNGRLRASSNDDAGDWLIGKTQFTDALRAEIRKNDPLAVQTVLNELTGMSLKEAFSRLRMASLLVQGQNDPIVMMPAIDQLTDLPEQSHAILFEQSGHFPMIDEEAKFNRLVSDFLALDSGETPRDLQLKEEWKRRVR